MSDTASLTLSRTRELRQARAWPELARLGDALSDQALRDAPEVGYAYAAACRHVGRPARALEVGTAVEAEARRRGARRLAAEAVNLVGNVLFETGRPDQAEARFGELLEYASEWDDEELAARASNNLGVLANVRGRRDLALACYQRATAAYQRLGDLLGLAETHHNLGISYRDLGFDREADAHFVRAIGYAEQCGAASVAGLAESERALLRVRAGDPDMATVLAERARTRFQGLGDPVRAAEAERVLAAADRARGRADRARARLDAALTAARAYPNTLLVAEVQRDRGLLLRDAGEVDAARQALTEAAEHFARLGSTAEAEAVSAIARGLA